MPRLALDYFDGRSARAQPAEIWLDGKQLHVQAALGACQYPQAEVRWPERQRHGQRQALLPDGGVLSCADAAAWDAWARAAGLHESLTVRWMQSWRRVALAALLLVALLVAVWRWGAPLAADLALRVTPTALDERVGSEALGYVDRRWLKPSALPEASRQRIRAQFAQLVAGSGAPAYQLHFRAAGKAIGPNAFALPGGHIVLTDALVELMQDEPDAVLGVLAHELGHVQWRHGMRMAVQASLLGSVAGLVLGDFSTVLAGIPALLAQQSYSRDFERQADAHARLLLRRGGIRPQVMQRFFERIAEQHADFAALPIAFSSHPADAERIAFFAD